MSREGAERRPLSLSLRARSADRNRMASQLRLHVLLPLAFLGLIGAAFGVYTMGKAPGGGNDAGVPLITTHPDKTKPKPARDVRRLGQESRGLVRRLPGPIREDRRAARRSPTTNRSSASTSSSGTPSQPAFIKLGLPSQKRDDCDRPAQEHRRVGLRAPVGVQPVSGAGRRGDPEPARRAGRARHGARRAASASSARARASTRRTRVSPTSRFSRRRS